MTEITLSPELQNWANQQVAMGASPSVDALVEGALAKIKEHQDWINEQVKSGLEDLEAGRIVDGEEVLAEIDLWLAELEDEIAIQNEWRARKRA